MGWINSQQFDRDHQGLRNVCAVDGQYGTEERPLALDDEGWRVHTAHFTDERSGLYGHQQMADDGQQHEANDSVRTTQPYGPSGPTLPDDGHRYDMTYPRGIDQFSDNLRPDADHHMIRVCGSADMARRMAEAVAAGVAVSFQRVDDDTAEA